MYQDTLGHVSSHVINVYTILLVHSGGPPCSGINTIISLTATALEAHCHTSSRRYPKRSRYLNRPMGKDSRFVFRPKSSLLEKEWKHLDRRSAMVLPELGEALSPLGMTLVTQARDLEGGGWMVSVCSSNENESTTPLERLPVLALHGLHIRVLRR
ncbi:hypothetical protein J6590_007884 [Homalodisca vitripennis]|nr:hypothetical protein J6590_007884 [Homalodisca vitripennis]